MFFLFFWHFTPHFFDPLNPGFLVVTTFKELKIKTECIGSMISSTVGLLSLFVSIKKFFLPERSVFWSFLRQNVPSLQIFYWRHEVDLWYLFLTEWYWVWPFPDLKVGVVLHWSPSRPPVRRTVPQRSLLDHPSTFTVGWSSITRGDLWHSSDLNVGWTVFLYGERTAWLHQDPFRITSQFWKGFGYHCHLRSIPRYYSVKMGRVPL